LSKSAALNSSTIFVFLGTILWYNFGIERHESISLLTMFSLLFICYTFVTIKNNEDSHSTWFWVGIVARLVLFTSLPILSDDYFRFIWDGRLLDAGINPFEKLPADQLEHNISGINKKLFDQLNSQSYFTIYPPLNQAVFWIAVKLSPQSLFGAVSVMRLIIGAADVANYFLIKKIAIARGLSKNVALIYFLNPLVLLEFTGNLHFESVMICFLLAAIWLLYTDQYKLSSLAMAFSIISKLLPVMYLPALLKYLSFKKAAFYYLIAGTIVVLSFIPLVSLEFLQGLGSSLGLYFQKFEFNASIYFIIRELGYWITGYNQIAFIGPLMGILTIVSILLWLLFNRKKQIPIEVTLLFVHLFYLIFATTVHPWYISTLVALTALTRYRFAVVWSGLVFLTYIGYYPGGFSLPSWTLYLEYLTVGILIFIECLPQKSNMIKSSSNNIDKSA